MEDPLLNQSGPLTPLQMFYSKMEFLEQYADTVVDYTSKYNNFNSVSYAPENLTGKPAKYPHYGDFPDTYMLRTYGNWWNDSESAQSHYMPHDQDEIVSEDYIILRFEFGVVPTNVIIYETYNPGAVVRLWGRMTAGQWYLLYEAPPQVCATTSRKFDPKLRPIKDIVNEIRLEFNQNHLNYHTSLDAIILAGYKPNSDLQLGLLRNGFLDAPKQQISTEKDDEMYELGPDLISMLPYEVLVHIFRYLDLKSLARCARVNKRWYEASTDSSIYQAISLKKYWVKVDNETLKLLKRRCRTLRKLDLSWCGNNYQITEDVFQDFLKKSGSQLTHLSLVNCDFVKNVALGEISKCVELVDLRLRNIFPSRWTFSFLSSLNKLVALDLYSTFITDDSLIKILKANRNLKHLTLDFCENLESMDQITETVSIYNNKMITFSCWKTISLTPVGVRHLARCSNLRELDMGWCLVLADPEDSLERIALGCKDLRRLIVSVWRGLADHHLLPIIRSCKQLAQIDLLGDRNITGDICECAFASLPKLELIDVSFCDGIKMEQVEVWREMHPEIKIHKNTETNLTSYWT